jgi:hypothetical protein
MPRPILYPAGSVTACLTGESMSSDPNVSPADPTDHDAVIERRVTSITSRFPDRFTDGQVDQIRRRVARSVTLGANLAKVELPNGIGPNFDPRAMANG